MIKSSENKISEECIKPNRKYHPEIGVQFKTSCFIYCTRHFKGVFEALLALILFKLRKKQTNKQTRRKYELSCLDPEFAVIVLRIDHFTVVIPAF